MSNERRKRLIEEIGLEIRRSQNVVDEVDAAATKCMGLNRTDGRCLDIIDQAGRVSAGQLAAQSGLTTGAITTVIDRLERMGYVRRIRDESDRRKVMVELTETARRMAWELYGPIADHARAHLDRYTDEQLIFLRDFMREGREYLARHLSWVRSRARDRGAGRGYS